MQTGHWLKVAVVSLIGLQAGLLSAHAQRRDLEPQVQTGTPPGLIKKVEPEYPSDVVLAHMAGSGRFRLTINPRSGEVDEVKIVQSCGTKLLNELAAKALFQWRFQPGTRGPVEVPVDFTVHGGTRVLH
jgi:TonB family protein